MKLISGGIIVFARYSAVITLLENKINKLPITINLIEDLLKAKGWSILKYDVNNGKQIELLKQYNIFAIAKRTKAFTYKRKTEKIIFIRSGLSANEKRMLLAHELGHIVLGHMADNNVLGYKPGGLIDEGQEDEANEFALEFLAPICVLTKKHINTPQLVSATTLLDDKRSRLVADEVQHHKKYTEYEEKLCNQFNEIKEKNIKIRYIVVAIITALILVTATITVNYKSQENIEQTQVIQEATPTSEPQIMDIDVVVTKSGQKYHTLECKHIKDKPNLIHMTINEAIQAGYEPCEDCKPDSY